MQVALGEALAWIDAKAMIDPETRVFIKPNLTWKRPTPGVTVTPLFLRVLVEKLLSLTRNIMIGESEGGQASFRAEEAFDGHGIYELEREFGVKVVNLSRCKHEVARAMVGGKTVSVELPSILLHDTDVFITVPVPKLHALTGVSIGFKNQWGCLGDKMRVTQHPRFAPTVLAINKLLRPRLCICDGTYFLDHTGPMMGAAIPMNLVVAGNDVGAVSMACCAVMKIDPLRIAHHRLARDEGMFPSSLAEVDFNQPPVVFAERQFRLRRALLNYIHLLAFRSRAVNRFFYDSMFANGLHECLWFVRRNRFVRRVLYGKYGPGEANRGGRVT